MNREQQDLNWKSLPRETREEIRAVYQNALDGSDLESFLIDFFGHHNLTSDTEPEEMLIVERSKVIRKYKFADICDKDHPEKRYWDGAKHYLTQLFGDKCLPDKAEEIADKCIEPVKEHFEKEQSKPKFKVGQPVRVLAERAFGRIEKIEVYDEEDNTYRLEYIPDFWFESSELEPYTEGPETKSKEAKEKQNLSLSDKQNSETKEYMEKELNLCELLKGCEGEELYSLIDGDVKLKQLTDNVICQYHKYHRSGYLSDCGLDGVCQLYPSRALYEKYPLDARAAWMEWQSERKPKRWRAKYGETYYSLRDDFTVCDQYENNDSDNDIAWDNYNYFRTSEEAQQAAEAVREALEKFHSNHTEQ